MAHPADTRNYCLKASHNGVPVQTAADSIAGKPFGKITKGDLADGHVLADCHSPNLISSYPELADYVDDNYSSWITNAVGPNPENLTRSQAETLVRTEGVSGEAWGLPSP